MVELPIAGPSNRFLVPQRDRRWPHVLSTFLLLAAMVVGVLGLVGWPRLKITSVHYDLIRLRAEVEQLQARERTLRLELERWRSPRMLAARAHMLGLAPPRLADPPEDEAEPAGAEAP
ncbi:MAG: hypothetical protein MUC56_00930 [Thermoanaerobaculales bacterium]|jgi:hypothetical protein|nr:hypothetical protein [Thermoanaerobaculales bacterium]